MKSTPSGLTKFAVTDDEPVVTTIAADAAALLPRASMASTLRVTGVSELTLGGVHEACHGLPWRRANSTPPARKMTVPTPAVSTAWARTTTGTDPRSRVLTEGESTETVGAVVSATTLTVTGDARPGVPTESTASAASVMVLPPAFVGIR